MKRLMILAAALVGLAPAVSEAKVLLWEGFESGALPSSFTVYQHPAVDVAVVDVAGNKVLQMAGSGVVAVGAEGMTDYTVEGDVYVYDASYWAYAAGLMFRGTGDFSSSATANTYNYQVRPGEMQLEKWWLGSGWTHVTNDYRTAPVAGAWHHFKVVARGARFLFYVDGQFVQEYNDPSAWLSGRVGFRTWGAGAYFDNLLVTDDTEEVALFEDFSAGVLDGRWLFQDQNGPGGSVPASPAFFPAAVTTPDGKTAMQLTNNGVAVIGDPAWTDYTVEADMFLYDNWYGANAQGLVFRATPPLGSWYGFDAYVWEGRGSVSQVEKWIRNAQYEYPLSTSAVYYTPSAWHHVKAVVQGAHVAVYTDGVLCGEFTDPAPHLAGAVGFRDYMLGGYYTNLKVTLADSTAPVTALALAGTQGANGWFTSPTVSGTLTPSDTQSAVTALWLGVNGALETPFPADALPLTFGEGRTTLTFHAVDAIGHVEQQQVKEVLVDATPPGVTVDAPCALPGNAGWCRSTVPVTLTASDGISGVAGLSWTVGVSSIVGSSAGTAAFTAGNGKTAFTWKATDVAGLTASGAGQVLVDTRAPAVTVAVSPTSLKANGQLQSVKITGRATDTGSGLTGAAVVKVTDKAGAVVATTTFGGTVKLKGTKGMVYTVTASQADVAGNTGSATAALPVK